MGQRIALKAIKRAENWLQGAQWALEDQRWDDVVYSAQMASEQAVKGVLLSKNLSFKRVHDVSDRFLELQDDVSLPRWFKDQIPSIANSLIVLTEQRALAGYGFEEDLADDYFKDYAPEALEIASTVLKFCKQLLEELNNSNNS